MQWQEMFLRKRRNTINLHNHRITDSDVDSKSMVKDSIHELGMIIEDNYKFVLDREIGIEFNIGSR